MFIIEKEAGLYVSIDGRNARNLNRAKLFKTEQDALNLLNDPDIGTKIRVTYDEHEANSVPTWKVRELEITYTLK